MKIENYRIAVFTILNLTKVTLTNSTMKNLTCILLTSCICALASQLARAGSATWTQSPVDNNWSNASNWMPNTVPNSTTDTATFGTSNTTAISIQDTIDVGSVTFAPGASAYTLTSTNAKTFSLRGSPSIINSSGTQQDFVCDGGAITVYGGTQALGSTIHFDVLGNKTELASNELDFTTGASVGAPIIDVEGSDGPFPGGEAAFISGSSAGSSTIVLHRGTNNGYSGELVFGDGGAGAANIIAEGASERGRVGGHIIFPIEETAGTSTITLQGPVARGALGATVEFNLFTSASASTLIADGGSITFHYAATGGTSHIVLTNRGWLDISDLSDFETGEITIGSLAGDRTGNIFLGSKKLIIGSNNTSTIYSGVIQDKGGYQQDIGGSVEKIGTRTLTLAGANLYTGGTTVTSGDLLVSNRAGSATGTGLVQVNGGRIGGRGTIAGPLTIGTGSGSGATLIPAAGTGKAITTTIESTLTLKADASYNCSVNTANGASDSVVANGVMIDPSATFALHSKGAGTLAPGTVLTLINNAAATPISGNFNGLTEGSTIVAGNNTYQISYLGGDGNDLTLTVVP
jgi:autotransporter-associated beta strand protein